MHRESSKRILGRPALHVVLALIFTAVFCWPILAGTTPAHTFKFLYAGWFLSLVALGAVSRGHAAPPAEDDEPADAATPPGAH
jgi:hypothetical protein